MKGWLQTTFSKTPMLIISYNEHWNSVKCLIVNYCGNVEETEDIKPEFFNRLPYFQQEQPTQQELSMLEMIEPEIYKQVVKIMEYLEEQQ